MEGKVLEVQEVSKSFRTNTEETPVFRNISFSAAGGEVVGVVGPNGCGKTTLLLAIAGLSEVDRGDIRIDGQPTYPGKSGLVFQNYGQSLLPWRNVEGNLTFPLEILCVKGALAKERVHDFISELGVTLPLSSYPYELSGGQQQLVAIIRALVQMPGVLLLDEPFASLDFYTRLSMHERIQGILMRLRPTVVLVSHEIDEAILLSDRVIVLGGRPAEVKGIFDVSLPRPRHREDTLAPAFLKCKKRVLDLLSDVEGGGNNVAAP
jgi:NitT/TauT family transport system ATP-binding protein